MWKDKGAFKYEGIVALTGCNRFLKCYVIVMSVQICTQKHIIHMHKNDIAFVYTYIYVCVWIEFLLQFMELLWG